MKPIKERKGKRNFSICPMVVQPGYTCKDCYGLEGCPRLKSDYKPSYGENKEQGGAACKCRPTNTLYWELSEADNTNCPMHNPDLVFKLP